MVAVEDGSQWCGKGGMTAQEHQRAVLLDNGSEDVVLHDVLRVSIHGEG